MLRSAQWIHFEKGKVLMAACFVLETKQFHFQQGERVYVTQRKHAQTYILNLTAIQRVLGELISFYT